MIEEYLEGHTEVRFLQGLHTSQEMRHHLLKHDLADGVDADQGMSPGGEVIEHGGV